MCERYLLLRGGDWWQLDDTYLALWCVFIQTTFSSGTWGIKESCFLTLSFSAAPKRSRMTKAPFSVEWLSQSSQAPKSPTQGTPHRSSPSAAGRRLASSSRPGLSERSKEKGAGKGREPSATPPAAGNRGHRLTLGWEGCMNCVPLLGAREGIEADGYPSGLPDAFFFRLQVQRGNRKRSGAASARAPRSREAAGGCARRSAPSRSAPWRAPFRGTATWAPPSAASWRAGCGSPRCRWARCGEPGWTVGWEVADGLGTDLNSCPAPFSRRSRPGFRTAEWSSRGNCKSWDRSLSVLQRSLSDLRCPCQSPTWPGHRLYPGMRLPRGALPWQRCQHLPWTSAVPAEHSLWVSGQHPAL